MQIFSHVPSCEFPRADLAGGLSLIDAFVAAGIAKSKGEARRTIEQGGGYVNNERVDDVAHTISENDLIGEVAVIRSGRKRYALVKVT